MVRSPWSGDFLTVLCQTGRASHETAAASVLYSINGVGLFAVRSPQGPQGPFTSARAGVHAGFVARLPLPLRERHRWIQPVQCRVDGPTQPGVLLSDDDGVTWREVLLSSPPPHRVEWPHEGVRWQNYGCEPTVVELWGPSRQGKEERNDEERRFPCPSRSSDRPAGRDRLGLCGGAQEAKLRMKLGAYYFAGWAGKTSFDDGTSQQPFIPVATQRWDRRPWEGIGGLGPKGSRASWYFEGRTPAAFETQMQRLAEWIKAHPNEVTKDRLALVYAWNEIGEGGWLVPCREDPDGAYLKVIRRVVLGK